MYLGDERACRVDGSQVAPGGRIANGRGDAVGAVQDGRAGWDLVNRVHKHNALRSKAFDDRPVVDDFVVDVERRAERGQRGVEGVDGHVHAGAETTRTRQNDVHETPSTNQPPRTSSDHRMHIAVAEVARLPSWVPDGKARPQKAARDAAAPGFPAPPRPLLL